MSIESPPSPPSVLIELYNAAVAGAAPGPATAQAIDALRVPRERRVLLFAFGKAARSMAAAAVDSLLRSLHSIVGGVMVTPDGEPSPYPTVLSLAGDHPIPGRRSFDAAAKIAEVAAGRRATDVAIVLISGGTSSLIGAPLRGQSEADLSALHGLLLDSGLDIAQMNGVRKRFSRWGGGRLALALAPAATHCLAVSDVIGDDLSVIGSGPCVPDPGVIADVERTLDRANLRARLSPTYRDYITSVTRGVTPETPKKAHPAFAHVTSRVIATNRLALEGAAAAAKARGLVTHLQRTPLAGEASVTGEQLARLLIDAKQNPPDGNRVPRCYVWGGETTVVLGPGARASGGGGRCQELALAAARVLSEAGEAGAGISLLAAGTDGRDGSTEAAGGCVNASTWERIQSRGIDPASALLRHESNGALGAAGALVPRWNTGTNVMDVMIGVIH
jgi:glycerate 2-kinase